MKKLIFPAFIGVMTLAACSSAPDSDQAEVGEKKEVKKISEKATTLTVDTDQSQIEWVGTKTTGRHHGTIDIKNGSVSIEDGKIVGGEFIMDMNTITVKDKEMAKEDKQKLTGHLKSGDFFKVEQYPTAKFVITSVEKTSEKVNEKDDPNQEAISEYKVANPTHKITGNLTMRDSTKSITFPAKVDLTDGKVDAIAKFNINRMKWGVSYEISAAEVVLRDDIHLGIKLVASDKQMANK